MFFSTSLNVELGDVVLICRSKFKSQIQIGKEEAEVVKDFAS